MIRDAFSARDVDDVGGVEWLRRQHRVVVLVRRVE